MARSTPLLTTEHLNIGYKSGKISKLVSKNLNLALRPGEFVCLLGSNGSGKSTLMRSLAGLQPPLSGRILLEGQSISDFVPTDLAKMLSLVLTERIEAANLTVFELVSLGRTPYTGWLGKLSEADRKKIAWALESTQTRAYQNSRIQELSDGERQKVMLARALAQDTNLIILDEPTAHLDLPSRVEIMHLLHTLARQTNKAILISTHELDLALQAADQLWIIGQRGEMTTGVPEDLVLNGAFEAAFAKEGFNFDRKSGSFMIHQPPISYYINVYGNQELIFWTKRALQREGIGIDTENHIKSKITIHELENTIVWELNWLGDLSAHSSLKSLLSALSSKKH